MPITRRNTLAAVHAAHQPNMLYSKSIGSRDNASRSGFGRAVRPQRVEVIVVMLVNAAMNRDPRKFAEPDVFDPDRVNARNHVTFGRGVHSCPGAPLARTEALVSLNRLLDRTSEIWIDEEIHGPAEHRRYRYLPTFILRGLSNLHIGFSATKT